MRLTEAKLKELILEAYREQQFEVSTPTWKSFPAVPKGFILKKEGDDPWNPGFYSIELMSRDYKKMIDITIDLNTGEVQINIFVREPDSKIFHWLDGEAVTSKEVFEGTYHKLTQDLLSISPDDI